MRKSALSKNRRQRKNGYDKTFRFRCYGTLIARAERVARTRGAGKAADIGREAVLKRVEDEELRLGLPPLAPSGKAVPA